MKENKGFSNSENDNQIEKDNENKKGKENEKDFLTEKDSVPVDEIISIFLDFEDHLLLLLEKITLFFGGKTTEKVGNTTLELYLDRLDLLRTNIENSKYITKELLDFKKEENDNNSYQDINEIDSYRKKNRNKENTAFTDLTMMENTNLNKERILNYKILEDKIISFLDGESTYDRLHALQLCSSFRFSKGELFLLDR